MRRQVQRPHDVNLPKPISLWGGSIIIFRYVDPHLACDSISSHPSSPTSKSSVLHRPWNMEASLPLRLPSGRTKTIPYSPRPPVPCCRYPIPTPQRIAIAKVAPILRVFIREDRLALRINVDICLCVCYICCIVHAICFCSWIVFGWGGGR